MILKVAKEKNGITLIALVITIIILLILTGVTITTLTGDNGILNNAKNASEQMKKASVIEFINILLGEWKIRNLTEGITLENFLNEKVDIDIKSVEKKGNNLIVLKGGYQIAIAEDGEILGEIQTITEKLELKNNFYFWNGTELPNTSYCYTAIDVKEGDIIDCYTNYETHQTINFLCEMNNNMLIQNLKNVEQYIVPKGVDQVYVSLSNQEYGLFDFSVNIQRIFPLNSTSNEEDSNLIFSKSTDVLESNKQLNIAERIDSKKNKTYQVYAEFDKFDSLSIGHGYNVYSGSWVTVDNKNITAYYYNGSEPVQMGQYSHELTINDYIDVEVYVGNVADVRAIIKIKTTNGEFYQDDIPMGGCNGNISTWATMETKNVNAKFICHDMKYDIFVFGDSFLSLGDPCRYPFYLVNEGYKELLLSGYGGATSLTEIESFRNILAKQKPKKVIWCLGMNDADSETNFNENWKNCIDEVIQTCKDNNIELILATIPNTPRVSNIFKNEWIRNSGYRYIDFAKAVGAEEKASTWYDGMLSSDNVHPTELGAKALAERFLMDVPELKKTQ